MSEDEQVNILLQLKNLQQFVTGTKQAGEGVQSIGSKAEQASAKTISSARRVPGVIGMIGRAARSSAVGVERTAPIFGRFFRGIERGALSATRFVKRKFGELGGSLRRSMHGGGLGVGSLVGGGLIGYLSLSGLKNAIESTTQLGVVSSNTARVTGMSTQSLAQLFALAQANGVSIGQLAMSFRLLTNNVEGANKGSKSSVDLFSKLGITTGQLHAAGGNLGNILGLVIDRFDKLPSGVTKTYIASKLFGRSWQNLLPVIGQGSAELKKQEAVAKMLGVTMGGSPVQAAEKLHSAQVYLKLAGQGLQIFIATKLLPVLMWLYAHLLKSYLVIRQKLGPAYNWFKGIIQSVVGWLHKHKDIADALKTALAYIVPVLIALKVAQLLWNAAMLGNPWTWIIIGIVALVTALIYAWKHSKTFRDVVKQVWTDVKAAFVAAWGVIKNVWHWIAGAATWAWTNVLKPVFTFIKNFVTNVLVPVFQVLGSVAKLTWRVITTAATIAWTIMKPILQALWVFISNVLVPILKTLWTVFKSVFHFIAGVVSWAWNNVLHPVLKGIKDAIGFISDIVSGIGGVFQKAFHIAGDAISWLWNHSPFKLIYEALKWMAGLLGGGPSGVGNPRLTNHPKTLSLSRPGGVNLSQPGGVNLSQPHVPVVGFRAFGGPIFRSGRYLVGERGPEIVTLPVGARVTPTTKLSSGDGFPTSNATPFTSDRFNLEVPVIIDRREVARAVARYRDERKARQ